MADNITVTPGSGSSVAADDVGGVLYQRVKIGIGADGAAADLAYGQQAKAASLPVVVASDQVLPASVADGSDVVSGSTADAAVTSDTSGSLSAKLRGLVKWAFERMPASLGQKAMTASLPVVLPSDQTVGVQITRSATGTDAAAVSVTTTATAIIAANANRKHLSVSNNGGSRIWLGADSGMTAGQAGNNFGFIDPGDSWETQHYTGGVWGRTESGTGYSAYLEVA